MFCFLFSLLALPVPAAGYSVPFGLVMLLLAVQLKAEFILSIEVNMSYKHKSTWPKFSLEFKQDAARLVFENGYTQQEVTDQQGVSLSAMRRWVRAERPPVKDDALSRKAGVNLANQDELVKLRRVNERLRIEYEILKKAAVFVAKETE
jgi:transposase